MLRCLGVRAAGSALGFSTGACHRHANPRAAAQQQALQYHTTTATRLQRVSTLVAKSIASTRGSSSTHESAAATQKVSEISPFLTGSSRYAQLRTYMTRATAVSRMRVQGVARRDVPEAFNSGGNSGGSQADSLTPYVREHLTRVYTLLASGCAVAGLGSVLMITTSLAKTVPFWLPMVGGFVPLLWLSFAPPANPALKLGLFYAFTLLEGMCIAPLILATSMKGVLVTSLVLTGAIFCGFSAASYLAPRASLVAWQGPLFGALLGMVALSLLNVFYPTAVAHSIILYGGLALFSVMIAVDTQAMIERARCGAGDHVQDALQLFLNVINIFVRIAQIMGSSD